MTRQEALEILDTIPTIGEQVDALEMAIEALQNKDWIPCSERLPKNDNMVEYLTCDVEGIFGLLTYYDGWNCSEKCKDTKITDIVAWQPLPEPYKEVE